MQALAVRSAGIVVPRERPSPLGQHNLLPAVPARLEPVRVPAASLTGIDGLPQVIEGPELHTGLNGHTRAMAIAAYRRHMIMASPEAKKALFIDTYL